MRVHFGYVSGLISGIALFLEILVLLAGCSPAPSALSGAVELATPVDPPESSSPIPTSTPFAPKGTTSTKQAISTATSSPTLESAAAVIRTASPVPSFRLMAVGDLMLARTIGDRIQSQGPETVFAGVSATLSNADLLTGNLECSLSDLGEPQPKAYTFAAPEGAASSLALAGFDLLSLANNHAMDFGPDAFLKTINVLNENGIATAGAGPDERTAHQPAILERNGLRTAFLAYVDVPVESGSGFDTRSWVAGAGTPGLAWAEPARIAFDVASARQRADLVVVFLHGGYERWDEITQAQRDQAHAAIDAGAALVLGSHPHVLQPIENYHGGLIAYSLGNFAFDGFDFPENYSAILSVELGPEGFTSYEWIPVVIDSGLPRLANPEESGAILNRVVPLP